MNLFKSNSLFVIPNAKRRNLKKDPHVASLLRMTLMDNKAIAAVEFALIMPVILLLFVGGFELTRYVLIYQKVSKTTSSISDLISRAPELYEIDFTNSFAAVEHMAEPYYGADKFKVVVSSISNDPSGNKINWQRCGGGTLVQNSELGEEGDYINLPAGFTLAENEETILAEVFYSYESIIGVDFLESQIIAKKRYSKPRLGALTTIKNNSGDTGC